MNHRLLLILKEERGFTHVAIDDDDNIIMVYNENDIYLNHFTCKDTMTIDKYIDYRRRKGYQD